MSYDLGQGCYRRGSNSWGMSCARKRCQEKTFKLLTMSRARTTRDASDPMFYHERGLLDLEARCLASPTLYTSSDTSVDDFLSDSIVQNIKGSCHKLTSFELEFSIKAISPRLPLAVFLNNLLFCAKNLEIIKMNLPLCSDTRPSERGWKKGVWTAFARNHWPHLRTLHLGNLFVNEQPFTEFLISHQTLKELVIWFTEIRNGSWFNVARELENGLQLSGVRLFRITHRIIPGHITDEESISLERFILNGRPNSLGPFMTWVFAKAKNPLGEQ